MRGKPAPQSAEASIGAGSTLPHRPAYPAARPATAVKGAGGILGSSYLPQILAALHLRRREDHAVGALEGAEALSSIAKLAVAARAPADGMRWLHSGRAAGRQRQQQRQQRHRCGAACVQGAERCAGGDSVASAACHPPRLPTASPSLTRAHAGLRWCLVGKHAA